MARRRHLEATHENHERWLLTYADMITLLTAFFIMLYSISRVEQQKLERVSSGARASMGIATGGRALIGSHKATVSGGRRPNPLDREAETMPSERIMERVQQFVKREKMQQQVSVAMDADGPIIRLESGGALFDNGTDELKPQTRQILEALFVAIEPEIRSGAVRKIRVEGHTDNVPIQTERFRSNWDLSANRATSVVQYLAERHPILSSRLEAAGVAYLRPVASNATPDGRAKNRRVEIRVLQAGPKPF